LHLDFVFFDTLRIYGFWSGKKLHVDFLRPCFPRCYTTYTCMDSRDIQCTYIYTGIYTNLITAFTFVAIMRNTSSLRSQSRCLTFVRTSTSSLDPDFSSRPKRLSGLTRHDSLTEATRPASTKALFSRPVDVLPRPEPCNPHRRACCNASHVSSSGYLTNQRRSQQAHPFLLSHYRSNRRTSRRAPRGPRSANNSGSWEIRSPVSGDSIGWMQCHRTPGGGTVKQGLLSTPRPRRVLIRLLGSKLALPRSPRSLYEPGRAAMCCAVLSRLHGRESDLRIPRARVGCCSLGNDRGGTWQRYLA
jgi:hypothetical protein